jgi:hypothetical protein
MKVDNPTPLDVTMMPMLGPGDTTAMTVIAKATYVFFPGGTELASEQIPISFTDQFYDEADGGGIRYESDMAPFKPNTDIVLSGSAHAPEAAPTTEMDVALKVGPIEKRLKVFGKRLWNYKGVLSKQYVATDARSFITCPIRYSKAFGGMDRTTGEYCEQNLLGKGFYAVKTKEKLIGRPLPRIEDPKELIRTPADHPPPAGFGFCHRAWQPRASYAGTYDNAWRAERSPRLPVDFDYRYYNGAHPDLQVKNYLRGDEPVALTHLTPEGRVQFNLPSVAPICTIQRRGQEKPETIPLILDTLFIESDERTFCLVWRGRSPIEDLNDDTIKAAAIAVRSLELTR